MAAAQADASDIDAAIRMGADMTQAEAGIDDSELQDELNALIKEVEGEKAAAQKKQDDGEAAKQLSGEGLKVPSHIPVAPNATEAGKILEHD